MFFAIYFRTILIHIFTINKLYLFVCFKVKSKNFLWFNCSDPNSQVNKRNWQLMAVTTSCTFPSNTRVQKYIQCHLRKCSLDAASEEGRYARFCHKVQYIVIFVFVWYFGEALKSNWCYHIMHSMNIAFMIFFPIFILSV